MESLKRLVGVLFAPTQTFKKIAEKPTWAVALLLLVVAGAAFGTIADRKIDPDARRDQIRTTLEERQGLRGEELEKTVDKTMMMITKFGWVGAVFGVAVTAVIFLLIAVFFLVGTKLMGGEIDFRRSLATTAHGSVPIGVGQLVAIPLLLAGGPIDPEAALRGLVLRSNLAFLAPETTSAVVGGLLATTDLFVLASAVLLVIGLSVVGRLSKGSAIALVAVWWLFSTAIRIGIFAIAT